MTDLSKLRQHMVKHEIAARGVRSEIVLAAMRKVPREAFLPEHLREFAYEDSPLSIDAGQTISQPYIVALMIEALDLKGGEKVLEIGTGSGYAAAVLAEIAREVYTVERISQLAEQAAAKLQALGYSNVHVVHGDGTLGWPGAAPYDAIIVAASGPEVPESLKQQLKIGSRLVMPVGANPRAQELVRVARLSETDFETEDLAEVRFVPLIGEEGWPQKDPPAPSGQRLVRQREAGGDIAPAIAAASEPFDAIQSVDLGPLLERIGDKKIVLLGESTHGTSEFYRMRERISQELIRQKGFRFVAIEGNWPDVARLDHYVRHFDHPPSEWVAFARFPTWMWRNNEMRSFVEWLHDYNAGEKAHARTAIYGLDIYSLYTSIQVVLNYLDEVDPCAAQIARQRYGCLTPWQTDPASYGQAALSATFRECEKEVVGMLRDILAKQTDYAAQDDERFMDAVQKARLVANAERYYRTMYYGSRAAWNLRDTHMFETLQMLLAFHGADSKAVVWAHNSHVGDAAATEMSARGEYNIGHLCRKEFGNRVYSVGFGTHTGTVAAASDWGGPMEVKTVLPSLPQSYEFLCHETSEPQFMLPLNNALAAEDRRRLATPRLERAIGVIYRPETELASHYFQAVLPDQFDEYIWFDETRAVTPLETKELEGLPDTYPFGL
jgi:protein-L-isoaspartate(D-aspartate) O-methyltransferase